MNRLSVARGDWAADSMHKNGPRSTATCVGSASGEVTCPLRAGRWSDWRSGCGKMRWRRGLGVSAIREPNGANEFRMRTANPASGTRTEHRTRTGNRARASVNGVTPSRAAQRSAAADPNPPTRPRAAPLPAPSPPGVAARRSDARSRSRASPGRESRRRRAGPSPR